MPLHSRGNKQKSPVETTAAPFSAPHIQKCKGLTIFGAENIPSNQGIYNGAVRRVFCPPGQTLYSTISYKPKDAEN